LYRVAWLVPSHLYLVPQLWLVDATAVLPLVSIGV